MKKNSIAVRTVFAGLALGLLFTVANAQSAARSAADYWPFKLGNTWTLLTSVQNQKVSQVITVSKVTTSGGKTEATLDYKAEGKTSQSEIYQVDDKSLMRLASGAGGASKISPPFPVVLFPLTDGKRWNWSGTILVGGKPVAGKSQHSVSGPETIKTDAGTFKAMRVHVDLTVSAQGKDQKLINDYWFAPNVGLVQQKITINGVNIMGSITSYKLK